MHQFKLFVCNLYYSPIILTPDSVRVCSPAIGNVLSSDLSNIFLDRLVNILTQIVALGDNFINCCISRRKNTRKMELTFGKKELLTKNSYSAALHFSWTQRYSKSTRDFIKFYINTMFCTLEYTNLYLEYRIINDIS